MRVPLVVVALATALRLAWVLGVPTRPVGDFAMYLESAAHLVQHRALDPEFVYMPGYVMLLALVQALGGKLLAAKLLAVALGGAAAGAVYGIARALWDPRAALVAGLLYAVWPAGIAVTSVTGTDLPAAALIALAGWALVRWGPQRPLLAAVLFGAVMGAAAWIRAVAMPLAALAGFYFWTRRAPWRQVAVATALSCLAAVLVLAPWAVRNRLRYGETFFTDSHGGLTALVGANPNSEGRYSRSLNRVFAETTGHRLLTEPHRLADREAYTLARRFTRFEPLYAAGLVVAKAERLLANERPLLYWPLYRQGVLRDPPAGWFARHRAGLETLVDVFWALLVMAALHGLVHAAVHRRWTALTFLPLQAALVVIYAVFFAEVRYQLPIAILLFPAAGGGLIALADGARAGRLRRARSLGLVLVGPLLVFAVWPALLQLGARLRDGHRWAAHLCEVAGRAEVCSWRRAVPGSGGSGIQGVWNGFGLALVPGAAAASEVTLPPGRYRVLATLDLAPLEAPLPEGTAVLAAGGAAPRTVALASMSAGQRQPVALELAHPGGPLALRLSVAPAAASPARLWLGELRIVAEGAP